MLQMPYASSIVMRIVGVDMQGLCGRFFAALAVIIALAPPHTHGQTYNLLPQPAQLEGGSGRLAIDESFRVALEGHGEPRLDAAAVRLIHRVSQQTGIPLPDGLEPGPGKATLVVHCDHSGEAVQSVREDESYRIEVTPQQARLTAPTPVGVLRGMETFLQLIEPDAKGFRAPTVRINDHPRFPWRGLMIDVCRHWMPIDVLQRNIDGMAAVKLNVLHLHLTDDQGFRIESKRYPKLQELGSDGNF
jgi:hexosaminidase